MEGIAMLKLLETFKMVYETKNFSKAAELLFISQPTVSAQIKQLEQDLDTPLFLRNGRKNVIATPQAEYLYEKALNLLDEWSTIASEIHTNTQHQSHCALGISHTYAMALMPDLMIALYNAFPTVHFRVSMMNSAEVLTALEQHQLDLGIIEKPLSAPSILRFPILKDQLVLAGDPQAGPWLVREASSGVYYYTKRYLEEQNIQGPIIEIASNELIVALLKQGFGCSILSKRAAHGIGYQLLDKNFERQFYLIQRKVVTEPAIEGLRAFIQEWSQNDPSQVASV
ncbi:MULTISPECIES: LysR family transcriptional regulator [unclassified Enterococcus]|jgi:DNA-binding transcriptional LysR family regulator|uniref:LysR substrate-binding domain-containing protein n=1 Tax=unclassified Enterococcus TaxID=2608891 RepID=UPI0018833A49|nr:LysR family transcriptional regulator [Enterococcus casseliflavus]